MAPRGAVARGERTRRPAMIVVTAPWTSVRCVTIPTWTAKTATPPRWGRCRWAHSAARPPALSTRAVAAASELAEPAAAAAWGPWGVEAESPVVQAVALEVRPEAAPAALLAQVAGPRAVVVSTPAARRPVGVARRRWIVARGSASRTAAVGVIACRRTFRARTTSIAAATIACRWVDRFAAVSDSVTR